MTKDEKMSIAFDMRSLGYSYKAISEHFETLGEEVSIPYAKKLVAEQINKERI